MLRPNMQTPNKSSRGTPARPKKRPRSNPHVAVPPDFLPPAPDKQPKPAPTPQPDEKPPRSDKPKYTLAEQIRRRNQERARQDAAAQKRPPSIPTVIYTAFDRHRADEHRKRVQETRDRDKPKNGKKSQETASSEPSLSGFPQDIEWQPDISALGLVNFQPLPDAQRPAVEPDWPTKPLTEGQKLHVAHLLSMEDDTLVRDMLIGIRRDGMPSKKYLNDYLAQFAEWGWDEISDERTLERLDTIRQSDWDAWLEQADAPSVETIAQDMANDTIESLQVIDANTGQVLLNRMGVLGAGGQQSVGLQEEDLQTFQGRDLIFVHNHPNGRAASDADLRTAFLAGAELLLVVTPRGYEYVYIRGENGMALAREGDASYEVAPATAAEYVELTGRSWRQTQADGLNPPEFFMLQDEPNWWERENIIVTYKTAESIEEVADRMGIPKEHLYELNEGNAAIGRINIPLPGWSTTGNSPRTVGSHTTQATFLLEYEYSKATFLISQWDSLSPVEQQVEMALMGSGAGTSRLVPFDNVGYDFEDTLGWIHNNEAAINRAATDFQIPAALLKTVLASELLYDYARNDQLQDDVIRANLNNFIRQIFPFHDRIINSWDGAGVANAHYPTLIEAYDYIASQIESGKTHPWNLDLDAPDLSQAPTLEVVQADIDSYIQESDDLYGERRFEELSVGEQEAARYWLRINDIDQVPWDLRIEIAHYLASDTGSARAAAMISQMYSEQLKEFDSDADIKANPRDMARVWGRYRTAQEHFDYRGNARLAHPIADYWSTQ